MTTKRKLIMKRKQEWEHEKCANNDYDQIMLVKNITIEKNLKSGDDIQDLEVIHIEPEDNESFFRYVFASRSQISY